VTFQARTTPRPTRNVINMLSLRPRLRRWTILAIGSLLLGLTAGCFRPRPWSEPDPPSSKSGRVWVRPAHGRDLQIRGLTLRIWEHQRPSSLSARLAERPPNSTRGSIRGGRDRVHHEWTPTHRAGGARPRNPRTPRNIRDAQGFGPAVEYAISRDSGRRRCGGRHIGGADFGGRKGQIRWLECHDPRRQRGLGIRRQPDRYLVLW
jgi:hypothetical protein